MGNSQEIANITFNPRSPQKTKMATWQGPCKLIFPEGVKKITNFSFEKNENIYEIELPRSLKIIEAWAFQDCLNLRKVSVVNGGNFIVDTGAFMNCSSLQEFPLKNVNHMGSSAFANTAITHVAFSENIDSISGDSFAGCKYVTEISIPAHIQTVGACAFRRCSNLSKVEFVPRNAEQYYSVRNSAFEDCPKLNTVIFADGISEIDERTFRNCGNLETIQLVPGIGTLKKEAFLNCNKLQEIEIPDVTDIEDQCFENCKQLKKVTTGPQLRTIGELAFHKCISLKRFSLKNSLHTVSKNAFRGCFGLSPLFRLRVLTSK